jgi:hypothetical protein
MKVEKSKTNRKKLRGIKSVRAKGYERRNLIIYGIVNSYVDKGRLGRVNTLERKVPYSRKTFLKFR